MEQKTLSILHLDDDPFELDRVRLALEKEAVIGRFKVESFVSAEDYRRRLARGPAPEIVLLDIDLEDPRCDGMMLAEETRLTFPRAVVLFCSSSDDAAMISSAFASGGDDFISKRTDSGALSLRVFQSYQLASLKRLPEHTGSAADFVAGTGRRPQPQVVGSTMRRIRKRIPMLLDSAVSSIYVEGESGTGKEVVADLVEASLPLGVPFVRVNCAAISPHLLESELFGHKKGAFTGAASDKRGLFEEASGGWLFLDEVSTLAPAAQAALLRAIENRQIRRVGDTRSISVDLRVLCASNEPLAELVAQGRFRNDLMQRLSEARLRLPPLRERPEETAEFIKHFCKTLPGGPYEVSQPAMEVLCRCGWEEGNVRELRNVLKAMTELKMKNLLTPLSIPDQVWERLRNPQQLRAAEGSREVREALSQKKKAIQITVPWSETDPVSFDSVCDQVLLEMLRHCSSQEGGASLRSLEKRLDLTRETMAKRLRRLAAGNAVSRGELGRWIRRGSHEHS